jgi:hypothetical protein
VTSALTEFAKSMDLAKGLLLIEARYKDPPRTNPHRRLVGGLRGGASVLMVAAVERYLRDLMTESLDVLAQDPPPVAFRHLPEPLRLFGVWASLEQAMTGPRYGAKADKASRYPDVHAAAKRVVDGRIDPRAFADSRGNPNSVTVRAMFKSAGIPDVFGRIRPDFDAAWAKPESTTFIADKLDEIVSRRHRVAHSADALSIGRSDLIEAARFLAIVAPAMDQLMSRHVANMIGRGKKLASSGK